MNEPSYPIPTVLPVDILRSTHARIVSYVYQLMNDLPDRLRSEASFDPVRDWAEQHFSNDSDEVMDLSFKILFNCLRDNWQIINNPLSALEDLVLDFRSSPWVSSESRDLLQKVAGISEYDGEIEEEKKYRQRQIFNEVVNKIDFY